MIRSRIVPSFRKHSVALAKWAGGMLVVGAFAVSMKNLGVDDGYTFAICIVAGGLLQKWSDYL